MAMTPPNWGRRLPNFIAEDMAGRRFEYHRDVVRGPTVMVSRGPSAEVARVVSAVDGRATVLAIGKAPGTATVTPGLRGLLDPEGKIRAALFPGPASVGGAPPEVLLADADQRLVARERLDEPGLVRIRAALDGLSRPAAGERRATAPVMLLPNLLDQDLRDRLIAAFKADNREGTVAIVDAQGNPTIVEMPDRKRRRDLTLDRGGPLYAEIHTAIAQRLMPELWKAWWIDRLQTEAFYVASYQAERGDFFSAHRDNNLPSTERRRIAVSIELNDDYEGGGLVFPEYSDDRWRAPAGGGLVFSCSLMHEAVPVTAGLRYVLLVFLAAPT
ncbi:2OG-Fe(II) oxygenase [Thalassobaculum sp.]|uniref:2OG-Fe(II) oxygenase family protein n=1 Tax=Thalassobaculum sp. TaxID=2022740 RepID=UPI0032EB8D0F